ncbi:MAG: DUF2059 domain-containing protein [Acidobacteriota bacterium]
MRKNSGQRDLLATLRVAALSSAALLLLAPPATAGSSQDLMQLTALADELAFDVLENRRLLIGLCNSSPLCRAYGEEVLESVEAGGQNLSLGPVAVPLVEELFEQLDETDTEALFDFYRSPLGQRIVEQERAWRTTAALEQVRQNGVGVHNRQSDERIALLEDIDSMGDGSALQRRLDLQARRTVEWVERRAERQGKTPQTTGAREPDRSRYLYHQRMAMTYESMSDEDLQLYVDFLGSTGGETWLSAKRDIRTAAVKAAAQKTLERLIGRLGTGDEPPTQN